MFKFASLAVCAIAADTDPVEPATNAGVLKYTKDNAVTASTTATTDVPAAEVCSSSLNNQIAYASTTVTSQVSSFFQTMFTLSGTDAAFTGLTGETAQTATCYKSGKKYMCAVSSYMIEAVPAAGTKAATTKTVKKVVMNTVALDTLPTFTATDLTT